MSPFQKTLAAMAILAVPALAFGAFTSRPGPHPCFTDGASAYRIAADGSAADVHIRIVADNAGADDTQTGRVRPDLRIRLVDNPESADVVLVDGDADDTQDACAAAPLRTVALDRGERPSDMVVTLVDTETAADTRLYLRSTRFSRADALALIAARWQAGARRTVAASAAY